MIENNPNNNELPKSAELVQSAMEVMEKISEPLKKANEAAQMLAKTIVQVYQSEALQNALTYGQKIIKALAAYDFEPMIKKFSEAIIPLRYVHLLTELKWPLFLINDDHLREHILSECAVNKDASVVREIVFNYCDEGFFAALISDWNDCPVIKEERKPILSEAIRMHMQESYYASVSILMCQIYGIASDIVDLAKASGLELDNESKVFISEQFSIRLEDIDKEKGKLIQMVAMTESGQLLWDSMALYLKEEILSSSDSKQRWETQPLRNKICHGDQLNFGTREHSIKSILVVDMLIQLAYEINRISMINNESIKDKQAE